MIYALTNMEPFSKDFGLRDQIQRAAVSVTANVAEGFDCESKEYYEQARKTTALIGGFKKSLSK